MPCNSSITTGLIGRHIVYRNSTHSRRIGLQVIRLTTLPSCRSMLSMRPPPSFRPRNMCNVGYCDVHAIAQAPPDALPPPVSNRLALTTAQLSRAAAQAVRLSVRNRAFSDALHIVNSLHMSTHVGEVASPYLISGDVLGRLAPSDFRQAASPRLSAHCFLHALIRSGRVRQAARFSEMMMKQGLQLRVRTLHTIMETLCRSRPFQVHRSSRSTGLLGDYHRDGAEALKLVSSRVGDPCSRAAIRILEHAKKYGYRRTQQMYDTLIRACLLQGEIIVASLLFVLLVKEFAVGRPVVGHIVADHRDVLVSQDRREVAMAIPSEYRNVPLDMMNLIVRDMEAAFVEDIRNIWDETRLQTSLQALANLAMLLEHGDVPFGHLSSLFRALYSCPKTKRRIWIIRHGVPKRVVAYPYFQRVLVQMIGRMKNGTTRAHLLPFLDARSYNALLFYALRHRLSPSLASTILTHMSSVRQPPVQPTITTYNILLRSATLLRKSDVAQALVNVLRKVGIRPEGTVKAEQATTEIPVVEGRLESHTSHTGPLPSPSNFRRALARLKEEHLHIPNQLLIAFAGMKPNLYTLTSYISHMTSTGRPGAITKLLFHLLPELRSIYYDSLSPYAKRELQKACLKRSVAYGPHFFAAVLNALVKAGKTGLAERIYILAHQAQQASWIPNYVSGVQPWCLSIHVYTSMMQCYAAEASKALSPPSGSRVAEWRSNTHILGWGRFLHKRQQLAAGRRRNIAGRRLGLLLFRYVLSGSKVIPRRTRRLLQKDSPTSIPPPPIPSPPCADVRFFNAALDVFRPEHTLSDTMDLQAEAMHSRDMHNVEQISGLREIAHSITGAGHVLPPGLLPVAGFKPGNGIVRPLDRSPYAFCLPSQQRFVPYRLPSAKSRGLSLRHRSYRQKAR